MRREYTVCVAGLGLVIRSFRSLRKASHKAIVLAKRNRNWYFVWEHRQGSNPFNGEIAYKTLDRHVMQVRSKV